MSASSEQKFDLAWYEELMAYNARISISQINQNNYWQLFITGILPTEAVQVARWFGSGYEIPTAREWYAIYEIFKHFRADNSLIQQLVQVPGINHRVKHLIERIETVSKESNTANHRTVADQMLMRFGVMEYVFEDDRRSSFGGLGQPSNSLHMSLFNLDHSTHEKLREPQYGARMRHYGVRLIHRISEEITSHTFKIV